MSADDVAAAWAAYLGRLTSETDASDRDDFSGPGSSNPGAIALPAPPPSPLPPELADAAADALEALRRRIAATEQARLDLARELEQLAAQRRSRPAAVPSRPVYLDRTA
ncbi:hypothetical protein ABIQ69_01135 [Agromyces sp. G08B096]|uniref:Uncharacterized protein n=1 Tax=Agromyces sp. G08B096 TaxID=3156399 RepID=A0AAU7W8M2_9MICO